MSARAYVDETCARCKFVVPVLYVSTPEGLETPPEWGPVVCPRCEYRFGSPLPGKGYCVECWEAAGVLTETDTATGVCMTCTLEAE